MSSRLPEYVNNGGVNRFFRAPKAQEFAELTFSNWLEGKSAKTRAVSVLASLGESQMETVSEMKGRRRWMQLYCA